MVAAHYATAATEADINFPQFQGQTVQAGVPIIITRDTAVNLGGPLIKDRWWAFGSYRRYDIKESVLAVRRQDGSPIADPNHQSNVLLRSDYQLNPGNRLNFVWWYNSQNRFFRRDTSVAFVSEEASWRQIEPAYIVQGQWTSAPTANLTIDTRLGYNHLLFPLGYQPPVRPADFSRQDVTLSTLTGAPSFAFLNPAQVLAFATSASYYKGNFLRGTHNFKFGFSTSANRNSYNYTVNGGINAYYNSVVPIQVLAYNTPLEQRSIFHETAAFVQDSWTFARRWTLNLGLRYEHFRTFNPAQTSPPATFPALFPDRTFPESADYVNWNNVMPRLGVAFDVTGKGSSVLRASYSRFDRIMGTLLAESLNPNGLNFQLYRWADGNGDAVPQTGEFLSPANLLFASGGIVSRVDPELERPYSEQVNVGYEQQLFGDLRAGVHYYYRANKRQFATRNVAALPGDYASITTLNGAPITNPLTNQPMTLFDLNPARVGQSDLLITNIPELDDNDYHAVEFTAVKRFARRWQLLSGFTIQRSRGFFTTGDFTDEFNNPNHLINRKDSRLDYDSTHVFKLAGTYVLPLNINLGANFQHYTGYPLQPTNLFTGLNQGPENIILTPRGRLRLPNVNVLNLRLSRPIKIREGMEAEPIVDFFNVTNSNTITGVVTNFGPNYRRPFDLLNPFIARFGLRITF